MDYRNLAKLSRARTPGSRSKSSRSKNPQVGNLGGLPLSEGISPLKGKSRLGSNSRISRFSLREFDIRSRNRCVCVCETILLSGETLPCSPAAEPALQPQIRCFQRWFPTGFLLRSVLSARRACWLRTNGVNTSQTRVCWREGPEAAGAPAWAGGRSAGRPPGEWRLFRLLSLCDVVSLCVWVLLLCCFILTIKNNHNKPVCYVVYILGRPPRVRRLLLVVAVVAVSLSVLY